MTTQINVAWIVIYTVVCGHYVNSQVAPKNKGDQRTVLLVAVVESTPFVNVLPDGKFDGFVPDLLKKIEELTPYNFSLALSSDGQYGAVLRNGTLTGMMGEVVLRKVDIAVPLTVTQERNYHVDFTVPIRTVEPVIVLRRPNIRRPDIIYKATLLLAPMEFPVWIATILSFFIASTVLYIISRTNPYEWRRMGQDKEATLREAESFTCLNSFWFVISTLAWQGYARAPRSLGGRIVVTAWWFFVLIFIVSYTASLTNFLRSSPMQTKFQEEPLKGFTDLSKSSINVAMISGGTTAKEFKDSDEPVDNIIYKKFEDFERRHGHLRSTDRGIRYVREAAGGEYAMIMESPSASYVVNRKPCDLYMVKEPKSSRYLSMAVGKTSTKKNALLEDINEALLSLYGKGIVESLQKEWWSARDECDNEIFENRKDNDTVPPFSKLNLVTFLGALLILAIGLILGGIVSAIEMCIYKREDSHPDETTAVINGQTDLASSELILGDSKAADATHV